MQLTLSYLALLLYLAASLGYLGSLRVSHPKLLRAAGVLARTGFALHTGALAIRLYQEGHPPGNLAEWLSYYAWAIVAVYILTEVRYESKVIGSFVIPLAVLLLGTSAALPKAIESLSPPLKNIGVWTHVILTLLGNAAFALACCGALMYLLQERQLKSKHPGALYHRLPSLNLLDNLCHLALSLGFPLLTLGLLSGALLAYSTWGSFLTWDGKQIWSIVTWIFYAALLHGRLAGGWRGRKAAILSIIGFCGVVFASLGANLLIRGTHAF
ncbi:MAG: C-type cytochrome biosis protein CcsB [candidate division NC10 bacterium]|jgi:cytochrome c-type biogenesis protein CcsB|nr:C-type cytochrome biosis protein CcsB [candidate division NC10 bacterium]MBM2836422.1 C-type cytochrome biosis protein CcsB [candidate division NC10 bacterium]